MSKPPKRRKRCTYCSKLIAVEHIRVMGCEGSGCHLNWRCLCNWKSDQNLRPGDQVLFDVYAPCECCGTLGLSIGPAPLKEVVDVAKELEKGCEWHGYAGTPAYSFR